MPRYPRNISAEAYYHLFNRGVEKRRIFGDEQDKRVFLEILKACVQRYKIKVYAYCFMDNHFHLFIQTQLSNMDHFMQALQSRYAQYFNYRYQRVGSLFQGRYKSRLVENDLYAITLIRYIHQNPIVGGICSDLFYAWSSYNAYHDAQMNSWLEIEWVLSQFDTNLEKARNLLHQYHLEKGTEGSDPAEAGYS